MTRGVGLQRVVDAAEQAFAEADLSGQAWAVLTASNPAIQARRKLRFFIERALLKGN
jgi:hypothetical protein